MKSCRWFCAPLLGLALLEPSPAAGQAVGTATIAGTVTDTSGAVMPGVTVEASSPALIEGTRAVVTNAAGRYSVVNLRPGTYTVTFTLSGFSTARRENVELTSDLTAQINVQLGVGALAETVIVGAEVPVVDVQGVATPRVYTREMMDSLPTGRTPAALMQTIPGVTPGFFGSQFRGTQDSVTMVDGMRATFMVGAGPSLTTASNSSNMYQEFSFSTAIDSAEVGQPGMRINLVPRDGGNQFRGSVFSTYTRDDWQASNVDDALAARGVREAPKTLKAWDFNPTLGGPIVRDRLWFQTTFQANDTETQVAGTFFDADPSPFSYVASDRPGVNTSENRSFVQRLTVQVTPKDKVAGFYDWSDTKVPYFYSPLLFVTPPPEATLELSNPDNYQVGGRWTRTHTSRLLLEASFLRSTRSALNDYRGPAAAWSAKFVDDPGLPQTRPEEYAILELGTNRLIGLATVSDANFSDGNEVRASATYVTGTHSFKAGFSTFNGSYHRPTSVIGNVLMRYSNGQPNQVVLTLPGNEREDITGDWAFFVQDRWTVNRLTVNGGLRMDWLTSGTPEQVLPASPWLGELRFAPTDVLDWKDVSPRLGAAYDLFGNGKTAVKVAVGRFVAGETVALTGQANPIRTIATTDTRAWIDANGDRTIFNADGSVQTSELGPTTNLNFGSAVPGTTFDPEVLRGWFKRGYNWETNLSVQHELLPRVGVTALYYRRTTGNQRANDNLRIDASHYDGPFCVTGPSDARLPGGGAQQICGLFDLNPSARGLVQNYNTFAANLGTGEGRKQLVQGYEININARLPRGAFLSGGFNFQDIYDNSCDFVDNPEVRFCETNTSYRPDWKLNGSYNLPLDVQISGTYQGLAGPQLTAGWNAPGALITPALGRPLSAGANTTKPIALIEPGTEFLPMRHLFDLRFSKLFNVQRYRFQVMADLYNAFNNNSITGVNTTFGAAWQNPTSIVSPRQFRLSAQFDF